MQTETPEPVSTVWQIILNNVFGQNSEWFWTMVEAIVVLVSLVLIYRQVKLQSTANMLSSLESLNDRWTSIEMRRARVIVCQEYVAGHKKIEYYECSLVLNFFEELGLYYHKKVFETDTLWSMYAHSVENYWSVLSPMIIEYRAHNKDNTYYEHFENLKNAFDGYARKKKLIPMDKTEAEKLAFAKTQIEKLGEPISPPLLS